MVVNILLLVHRPLIVVFLQHFMCRLILMGKENAGPFRGFLLCQALHTRFWLILAWPEVDLVLQSQDFCCFNISVTVSSSTPSCTSSILTLAVVAKATAVSAICSTVCSLEVKKTKNIWSYNDAHVGN